MTSSDAVRRMLEPRSVAIVGASPRPGSFGDRLLTEAARSPAEPLVHPVNPRYAAIGDRICLDSLDDIDGPVDLVLMGIGDTLLETTLKTAAARGDGSAVVFGSAVGVSDGLRDIARDADMALCGAGCMGFLNLSKGIRAIGYLERIDVAAGPVALVSHSGSAFSALLRSKRRFDFSLAVSSGQELVTTTADYLDYALDLPETRVVALLQETVREPERLRAALTRAADDDVPVVLLAVGGTTAGADLVAAHSGALAGGDAMWEALTEAHGLLRVDDLDEMADLLELLCAGRRATYADGGAGRRVGIATVHDSGAERVLTADIAHRLGVPFGELSPETVSRLTATLEPGLLPTNPLDVWGTGAGTRELFGTCLTALADDDAVAAVALAVDLVEEYDQDTSYRDAVLDAAARTEKPMVLLSNMASAVDDVSAEALRAAGVPVLEGTRSGLRALGRLLELSSPVAPDDVPPVDPVRQERWRERLRRGPLSPVESFALLSDYGIATVDVRAASSRDDAVSNAEEIGYPVVLKTAADIAHKSDVGGVVLGLLDAATVAAAYDDMSARLGPDVVVCQTAERGVEIAVGLTTDPLLGPVVVVAVGGVLIEVIHDRVVGLPPFGLARARRLVDRLAARAVLDGVRGENPSDIDAACASIVGVGQLAVELRDEIAALDVNPIVAGPYGAVAVDALVVRRDPTS